jgi:hypothetical protein
MRLTHTLALLAVAGSGAIVAPAASAQAGYYGRGAGYAAPGYSDVCASVRRDNQTAGLVLGGIIGGVLGSNVAARGHRDDGTALGAVVGALAGSEIGRGSARCGSTRYGHAPPPQAYGPYGYDAYPATAYPPLAGAPGYGYRSDDRYYDGASFGRDLDYDDRVAGGYDRPYRDDYRHHDDVAARECAGAKQITRLPDGTEIHRPVEACRNAYYGDWTVKD